ncbi:MAG: LPS assembly protein LptD [Thermodesulfobacteriota bacterium]
MALAPDISLAENLSTEEWDISADKITNFSDPKSIIAEGHVLLIKRKKLPAVLPGADETRTDWAVLLEEVDEDAPPVELTPEELGKEQKPRYETRVTIKADWVAYDLNQATIRARGNISLVSDGDQLIADEATVDLNTETGQFSNATILQEARDVHLEGQTIAKTGFNTYTIDDGWVITCKLEEGETPPWSFAAKKTHITEGGYAFLKHTTFRIKDVPVMYLPWMAIPIKNKRQTGFTTAELSNSDWRGWGFNIPFFWNISDSADITLFPEIYQNRGFMPGFEARYIVTEESKGTFTASYLKDALTDPSETDYYKETGFTHTNDDRYWVRGKLDHSFGSDWISRVDLDIVSDRDFLTEFNTGYTGFRQNNSRFVNMYGRGFANKTSNQRQNTAKLLKSWTGMSLTADLLAINDVRPEDLKTKTTTDETTGETVVETTPTPLWKLPALSFTGNQAVGETGITFEWHTDYVNYWRDNGIGAHRFDIEPTLSTSIPLGPYLESRAEVGLRDTYYNISTNGDAEWEHDSSQNRFLYTAQAEIGTTLKKDFALTSDTFSMWDHTLRPYIKYDFIPKEDQEDLPTFDGVDRVAENNRITYGVDNFINLFRLNESFREYGYLKITQSYDLRTEAEDEPFSWINLRLGWNPIQNLSFILKGDLDPYGDGFVVYGLETNYNNSRGDYLTLDYRYNEPADIEQLNVDFWAQLFPTIFAGYQVKHSFSESETIEQNIALMYQPACWAVELRSQIIPGETSMMVIFRLANLGNRLRVNL